MSDTSQLHRTAGRDLGPLRIALVTISDTRTAETDRNGAYLRAAVPDAGHRVCDYRLIPDEPARLAELLEDLSSRGAQVILLNGGTGIASRDTTFDVLTRRLEKTLPGFGELFRLLSFEQVGSAAMLSRAVAGTFRGCLVFSMPGSPEAVRLAWERLIEPELGHLAWELSR
jgi:molybdopterin adenylyltransferase